MNELGLKPYSYEALGADGREYGMLTLCTPEARVQLQKVGLLPEDVREVIGLQKALDIQVAVLERDMPGVVVQ